MFFPLKFSGCVIQLILPQGAPSIFADFVKNLKTEKADPNANQAVHPNILENLERLFSSPPFLKRSSGTVDQQDAFELDIGLSLISYTTIYILFSEIFSPYLLQMKFILMNLQSLHLLRKVILKREVHLYCFIFSLQYFIF